MSQDEIKDLGDALNKIDGADREDKKATRKGRKPKEKKEYKDLPTAVKQDDEAQNKLEHFMSTHHFAPGWKREIRAILGWK